jgi:ABC-type glycerol-3-phosphate transport system substrate-binding protein
MDRKKLSRREFLRAGTIAAAGAALAACAPAEPQVIRETVEVIVEQTVEVETEVEVERTVVVEATEVPIPTAVPYSAATGEVVFWSDNADWTDWVVESFNDLDTGVTAVWEYGGRFNTQTKWVAAVAAGTPPPLLWDGRWQAADMAIRNAIISLDDFLEANATFRWEDLWQRLGEEGYMWGKRWTIPYNTNTRSLFYNKEMMAEVGLDPEKPPETWPELHEMAIALTKEDSGRLDQVGFTPGFGNPPVHLSFMSMLWCKGGTFVDPDLTKVTMVDAGIEAMTFMKQLMDDQGGYENTVAFARGLTLAEGIDAFSANKVGIAMNGTWVLPNYDRYAPDLDYGIAPGPIFEEHGVNSNYDGGQCWFVFRSDKISEALKFVEGTMREDFQLGLCEIQENIPSRRQVAAEWVKTDPRREIAVSTAETVRFIPNMYGALDMMSYMADMFDNILIGGEDIEEQVLKAAEKIQEIVDRHNSFPDPEG